MIKTEYKVIIISVIAGLSAGLIDTVVGYLFFSKGPFWDLLILEVPSQEIYVRTFLLLIFLLFGLVIARFMTERRELQDTITRAKKEWEETFDIINDAITIHDKDFNIIRANRAAEQMLGLPFRRILSQKCYTSYHKTGSPPEKCPSCRAFETGLPSVTEIFEPSLDKYIKIKALPRFDRHNQLIGCVHVVSDITQRIETEEKLRSMSLTDELTRLSNRRGFFAMAEQQLKLANRNMKGIFMLYADLDNLKVINDTLGHQIGDLALIETGTILKELYRDSDIIARMGGDEFVVFPVEVTEDSPEVVTARLEECVQERNAQSNRTYTLSISVGVAYYDPARPCSIHDLVTRADKLMYEQKKMKRLF